METIHASEPRSSPAESMLRGKEQGMVFILFGHCGLLYTVSHFPFCLETYMPLEQQLTINLYSTYVLTTRILAAAFLAVLKSASKITC